MQLNAMKSNEAKLGSRNRAAVLLAAPLAASMLLTGCGGESKPDASPSSTAASSPTTTAPPTTSASPTPTTKATTDPDIPAAARVHTPAGAEAFVRYFFSQLNRSWSTADPSLLSPLSAPGCKTCAAFTASAAEFASKNQHYKGAVFSVTSIAALGQGPRGQEVLVIGKQEPGAIVNSAGSVVKASVAQSGKFVVSLKWTGNGWSISELQVQK